MRLIGDLHNDGYNVLTFDLRNHGESATAHPVTFGQSEAKDLLGAPIYLDEREDVDCERIGALGFSIGANAILFALPQSTMIKAAIAVQPMTPALFTRRINDDLFGVFGFPDQCYLRLILSVIWWTPACGNHPWHLPLVAVAMYRCSIFKVREMNGAVLEDVSVMADMTPGTEQLLFVNSQHRFGGYNYMIDHPNVALSFFQAHLGSN